MTYVGLIPPIPECVHFSSSRPFHLILNHLLVSDKYREFCIRERQKYDSFLTLDNSAHEYREGQRFFDLLKNAVEIDAQELVVPDKLFSSAQTLANARVVIQNLNDPSQTYLHQLWDEHPRRLMFVPQGQSFEDYSECFTGLLDLAQSSFEFQPNIFAPGITIGVSKDYEILPGGLLALLDNLIIPTILSRRRSGLPIDIHLLGWGRDLKALSRICSEFGSEIRSVDSAKPFVYGLHLQVLNPDCFDSFPYPSRPKNYFDLEMNQRQTACGWLNVKTFEDQVK